MTDEVLESGRDFESRGLKLARALHDPTSTRGAVMFNGRERDGLFVDQESIHAYEFTTESKKLKAEKDGAKLAELLSALLSKSEHRYKTGTGWFVTKNEPTAEQRTAIDRISRNSGQKIHAVSIAVLYSRICDSAAYLQRRDNAPFGSVEYSLDSRVSNIRVDVSLASKSDEKIGVKEFCSRLAAGQRALVVGDFGVGKSHALREVYRVLKKEHYRHGNRDPFPVHINLRECAGLKSPSEILRRHAADVGFDDPDGLISAWRAGSCVLLLDGFDEVVPVRWLGGVSDLKSVRFQALAPIRRLVSEMPVGSGIVVAGRAHYFSTEDELVQALGFRAIEKFEIDDFDEEQLRSFLEQSGVDWKMPYWVPMKPLFLGYLVSLGGESVSSIFQISDRARGWRTFLDEVCNRESRMFTAVRPEVIKSLISRVATLARARSEVMGPVSMEMLRDAFAAVNGRQPDEEGIQLLQRLPGLAITPVSGINEERIFVDRDLAETGYGEELANYVFGPHAADSPLNSEATWSNACEGLAVEVAADLLSDNSVSAGSVISALYHRQGSGNYDAVTADLIEVTKDLASGDERMASSVLVSGVYFERFEVEDSRIGSAVTYQDCLIDHMDLSGIDPGCYIPEFRDTVIGFMDGVAAIPDWASTYFHDCEIGEFSLATRTSSGIMQLEIDKDSKIALTVLKKVYLQRGAGRKEGALVRGLDPADRPRVSDVVATLVAKDWLSKVSAGRATIYAPVPFMRGAAIRALESPSTFRL